MGASKGEVDGQALERNSRSASGVGTSSGLGLFGTDTDWTSVKNGVHVFKLRHSENVAMSIVKVVVTGVSKTLMPEETFG